MVKSENSEDIGVLCDTRYKINLATSFPRGITEDVFLQGKVLFILRQIM